MKEIHPKVSVIVPVWNPGPGIGRCIESLRGQTLEDIEMIFVDDCGTDNAMEVVRAAAVEDSRIRILTNEKNMGPGNSRNRGIEVAQGEYLSFIDADDYVAIDFLELLYKRAKEEQTDIAKGLLFPIKSDGTLMWKKPQANRWLREKLSKGIPLYRAFTRGHTTAIYKREFLFSNDIRYSLARRGEDVVFFLRVCSNTDSISIVDNAIYYYCERETSAVHTMGVGQLADYFDSFRELVEYALDYLPDNEYTKDYLQELFLAGIKEIYRYDKISGMENDSLNYLRVLRAQWLRIPNHDEWARDYYSLHVMQEYDYLLPTQVYKTAWDAPKSPVRNALLLKHWVDFYLATPGEREALSHDLEKIIRQTKAAVSESNHYFSLEEKKQGLAIFEKQMKRYERAKRSSTGFPWLNPLYHAAKRWRENLRHRRMQAHLRKRCPIIRQGSSECFEDFPLRVSWDVTSHCNFRCSYCYYAGREYKKDFCTLEQAETAIRHLASANRPSYQVNLIGGEPTTHPHLAEIITLLHEHLGDRLEKLEIISNGSFSESKMEAILKAGGGQIHLKLNISIHLEYMSVEKVVELVKQYSSRTHLQINLMFHPELVDKAMSMAEALCDLRRDYPFWMVVSMLQSPPDFDRFDSRYKQEHFNSVEKIRERFREENAKGPKRPENEQKIIGWEFLVEREVDGVIEKHAKTRIPNLEKLTGNRFTGMTCCAGTNVVWIRADGRVKGMICGLDSPTCNIFEENPFMREDWIHGVFCTKAMCGCSVNYRIPKFRSPTEAQKFIAEKKQEQKSIMNLNR